MPFTSSIFDMQILRSSEKHSNFIRTHGKILALVSGLNALHQQAMYCTTVYFFLIHFGIGFYNVTHSWTVIYVIAHKLNTSLPLPSNVSRSPDTFQFTTDTTQQASPADHLVPMATHKLRRGRLHRSCDSFSWYLQ